MNKFKFYFLSALICGFSLGMVSCGDDEKDEEGNKTTEMKGGDLVGAWVANPNASSLTITSNEFIKSYIESALEENSEIFDFFGTSVGFNDDNTFVAEKAEGTYEANGNQLSFTYQDKSGKEYTAASGKTIESIKIDNQLLTSESVKLTFKNVSYNVGNGLLSIKVEAEGTCDLSTVDFSAMPGGLTLETVLAMMGETNPKQSVTASSVLVFSKK